MGFWRERKKREQFKSKGDKVGQMITPRAKVQVKVRGGKEHRKREQLKKKQDKYRVTWARQGGNVCSHVPLTLAIKSSQESRSCIKWWYIGAIRDVLMQMYWYLEIVKPIFWQVAPCLTPNLLATESGTQGLEIR